MISHLAIGLLLPLVDAAVWTTGDNSTVRGCKSSCSPIDYDCWQHTADYVDQALIAQLRHYTTAQISLDQWYYRHVSDTGMNKSEVRQMIYAKRVSDGLVAGLQPEGEILDTSTVRRIAVVIGKAIEEYSDHVLGWPPQYSCPLPCDYRNTMYIYLFSISACVNLAALIFFLPHIFQVHKMTKETTKSLRGDLATTATITTVVDMSQPLSQLVFQSDLFEDGAFELLDSNGVGIQPDTASYQSVRDVNSRLIRPMEDFLQPNASVDEWLHNTGPLTSGDAFDDHRYGPSDSDFDRLVNSNHDYYDKVPQMDFENDLADHSYAYFIPPLAGGVSQVTSPSKPNAVASTSSSTTVFSMEDTVVADRSFPDQYGMEQMECQWTEDGVKCTWKDSRYRIEDHVSSMHIGRGVTNPVCRWDRCRKTFVRRYLLLRHVRCIHCDDKPYSCSHCGQRFALRERMKLHQRVTHGLHPQLKVTSQYKQTVEGEESTMQQSISYPCKECDQVFPTTAHRRHHVERIHMMIRFKCEHCGTSLADRSSLIRHKKKMHPHLESSGVPPKRVVVRPRDAPVRIE